MNISPGTRMCRDETEDVLIVEGRNDCFGIYHMANKVGFEPPFGIWEGGGADGALARFGGLLLSTRAKPKTLGIVLDCDSDDTGTSHGPMRRWDQIQSRLRDMPYVVPSIPALMGTIIEGKEEYPRIGVWLMPDNQEEGMLEDFLLQLVPTSGLSFAREVIRDAKARGFGGYKGVHESAQKRCGAEKKPFAWPRRA